MQLRLHSDHGSMVKSHFFLMEKWSHVFYEWMNKMHNLWNNKVNYYLAALVAAKAAWFSIFCSAFSPILSQAFKTWAIWTACCVPARPLHARLNSRTISWNFRLFARSLSIKLANCCFWSLLTLAEGNPSVLTRLVSHWHRLSKYFLFRAKSTST